MLAERAVGVDGLDLRDDVELAAPVALEGDVGRGLEPGAELGRGLADPLGDGPDLAVALGHERHDPVGLAELDRAEHHTLIPIQPAHSTMSNYTACNSPRYSTCGRWGWPSGSAGWSKSSAGSWVMPSFCMTRWDRRLATVVNDTTSSRPRTSKP